MTTDKTVQQLGYAGLIPFVFLAALMWLVDPGLLPFVSIALVGYAAVIASFLGGVHWGIGFTKGTAAPRIHFVWGVMPSLLAWLALLMPADTALLALTLVVVICYGVDSKLYRQAGLARWLPMRLRLTAVAAASCLLGAAAI
jgi:steroid 5-alpha reductase family enzyme